VKIIRGIFLENITLKASAAVLAVILWFFVVSKGQTEISLNVPIEYSGIPSGLEISHYEVKSANIVVRSHESLSRNIRQDTVRVSVDMSKAKKGEGIFSLRKDDVRLPYGASVVRIDPLSVKVLFEETVSKKVAVMPDVTGTPEKGYYLKSVEVSPAEMAIEGAKSVVRKVATVSTEPIDITGLTEDFKQDVMLKLRENGIRSKTEAVHVHIKIARRGK
jgi:YbbR domain-containing protein